MRAEGGTPTLAALKMALAKERAERDDEEEIEVSEESVEGIYLLTDGKPDTSMSKVSSSISQIRPPM